MDEKIPASMREFELAWQEFFKNKPKPKNDDEDKQQQEEFHHWYNFIRKQSDTGKTPAEMYKEIYGKEPPKNPQEISRMMNFEWDDDYSEEISDDEASELKDYFYKEIYPKIKNELKERSRREACFICFIAGSEMMQKSIKENMKDFEKKLKNMSPEEIKKIIEGEKND